LQEAWKALCAAFRTGFVIAVCDALDDLGALGDGQTEIGDLAVVDQTIHARPGRFAIFRAVCIVLTVFAFAVAAFGSGLVKTAVGVTTLNHGDHFLSVTGGGFF